MNEEKLKALQEALDLKQRELDLLLAIDEIRDTVPEPVAMLTSIVELLAERLEAGFCLMFLRDRETGELELRAASDRTQCLGQWQSVITRELAEQAMRQDDVTIWDGLADVPAQPPRDLPVDGQLAAVPILVSADERLGALLLARSQRPFDAHDVQLLKTAEDLIDSAVIHWAWSTGMGPMGSRLPIASS